MARSSCRASTMSHQLAVFCFHDRAENKKPGKYEPGYSTDYSFSGNARTIPSLATSAP
jgi:hypothetical protein